MTREEALRELIDIRDEATAYPDAVCYVTSEDEDALNMAIEALQTEVVRCKDCIQKHIGGSVTQYYWCDFWDREVDCNNGCSWGERREDGEA